MSEQSLQHFLADCSVRFIKDIKYEKNTQALAANLHIGKQNERVLSLSAWLCPKNIQLHVKNGDDRWTENHFSFSFHGSRLAARDVAIQYNLRWMKGNFGLKLQNIPLPHKHAELYCNAARTCGRELGDRWGPLHARIGCAPAQPIRLLRRNSGWARHAIFVRFSQRRFKLLTL